MNNERYYGLPTLAYLIRWALNLLLILSKPCLVGGVVVSMIDLLTHGSLLSIPVVFYGWALAQGIAVEGLLDQLWRRASLAWKKRKVFSFLGHSILGLALAFVTFAALALQSLQQSLTIGSNEALAMLGLNLILLIYLRSAVSVVLLIMLSMISPEETSNVNQAAKGKLKMNIHWPQFLLDWYGKFLLLFHSKEVKAALENYVDMLAMENEKRALGSENVASENLPVESENVEVERVTLSPETLPVNSEQVTPETFIENEVKDVIPFDWSLTETVPALLHFPVAKQEVETPVKEVKPLQVKSEKRNRKPQSKLHVVKSSETSVRDAYDAHPDANISELVKLTNLSRPTVKKWKDSIDLERQKIEHVV